MSSSQKTKIFFPNLDGLRFIAFALVFSEHIIWGAFKLLDIEQPLPLHVLYTLLCNGGIGVSVFFVLSGFLITFLILKEIDLTGKIDVKAFYIRRFLRIWPLYYILLIFAFYIYPYIQSLFHIHPEELFGRPLLYFTFLSNFDMIHLAHHNLASSFLSGVTWSVAVEEQFYLLWPLLFFIIPKKKFIYIFIGFIILSLLFRLYYFDDVDTLYFHSLSVCGDLAIGGLSAYFALHSKKFRMFFETATNTKRVIIYLSGVLFILFSDYYLDFRYASLYNRMGPALFFAWVIMDQNYNKNDQFKLSNFKWISKWGKYTYGMYLLHQVAFLIVLNTQQYFDVETGTFWKSMLRALIVFVLTCMISYFSYHWFEKYFLKLKARFAYFTKD